MAKCGGILEQLLNQIDVCHYHTSAAVSLAAKLVHGISVASHRIVSALSGTAK